MIAEMTEPRQRKKDPYKRLAEINRAITTSLDFDRVLNLIVENAAQLVDASACMLLLADAEQRMRIRASLGIDKSVAASFSGYIEEDLIKRLQTLIPSPADGSMISVPIIAKQALNGLLVTDDYPPNHLHHHGIWFPWTKTRFEGREVDFWNMGGKTGTVEFVAFGKSWNTRVGSYSPPVTL